LLLPCHEFNKDRIVITRCRNLKWNYLEFQVSYECLKKQYLVWKYYLAKLLVEDNLPETQRPKFTEEIKKPVDFWNELKIKFMSSVDEEEQKIILKVMCVLYNQHFKALKELKSMPYWIKLLDHPSYRHC